MAQHSENTFTQYKIYYIPLSWHMKQTLSERSGSFLLLGDVCEVCACDWCICRAGNQLHVLQFTVPDAGGPKMAQKSVHFPVTALHQILAMFSNVLSVTPFFHACSLIVIARQYAHSCHWTCSAPRLGISPLVGWVSRYKLLWRVHQVNWQPLL